MFYVFSAVLLMHYNYLLNDLGLLGLILFYLDGYFYGEETSTFSF